MAPQTYQGPLSLGASRYASHQPAFTVFPAATPNTNTISESSALATKEQVVATQPANESKPTVAATNPDAELAVAQNLSLKEEVEKHAACLSTTVSTVVENTRNLLVLIRDSIDKDGHGSTEALKTVGELWVELQRLFKAISEAKAALPHFMEKQKENMSLYHSSAMNEVIRESQEELNLHIKKVNIQHSLILEHQHAFTEYKERTESKLAEVSELQDRVSRLQLEQGLFKTEIGTYKSLLHDANKQRDESAQAANDMRKEFDATKVSNKHLSAQNSTLRGAIDQLQEKVKIAEHQLTVVEKDLAHKNDALYKEVQKYKALQMTMAALQNGNSTNKQESEALKAEHKQLQVKFANQSDEHSKMFSKLNGQESTIASLKNEISTLKQENDSIKSRLQQLDVLEKARVSLSGAKEFLEKQVQDLKARVDISEKKCSDAEKRVHAVLEKTKKLEQENDELELENNELSEKATKLEKVAADMKVLKENNAKLQAAIVDAHAKPMTNTATLADEKGLKALTDKLAASEERCTLLETSLHEWQGLAKQSYKEYKDMLPTYKQAEQHREECIAKDKAIADLQRQLQTANDAKQTNSADLTGNAVYWKQKYEMLLASTEN